MLPAALHCLLLSSDPAGSYAYFSRYVDGAEHPIISRISRADFDAGKWSVAAGAEPPASLESLLDANALAAGLEFFKLGGSEHSPDHSMLAYATDIKGSFAHRLPALFALSCFGSDPFICHPLPDIISSYRWSYLSIFYNPRRVQCFQDRLSSATSPPMSLSSPTPLHLLPSSLCLTSPLSFSPCALSVFSHFSLSSLQLPPFPSLTRSEYFTIVVKDLKTGRLLPDRLVNTSGSFEWSSPLRPPPLHVTPPPSFPLTRWKVASV